jgi:cysteine synthase A
LLITGAGNRFAPTIGGGFPSLSTDSKSSSVVEAIGNTPLIRLRRVSDLTGCEILGKAEFLNPGGSVKDRPARHMILEAEKRGQIRRGGLIVEGTAGNTGIGLALVGSARGYRTVIVIPDTQSQEKKDTLRMAGATLIEVPAKPYSDPDNYQHVARRLAAEQKPQEKNGVLFADQWNNLDNRAAHYLTTGPEIWQQTGGAVDGFICSIGTGGTLAGVAAYLREKKPGIVIGCADPEGAAMFSLFTTGQAKVSSGESITEGIGLGRSTPIVADLAVDHAYIIPDGEALPIIFDLVEHEGLILGGSSGINVAGAVHLARALGPGHIIVTVLADSGVRYQSKLFNPAFLRARGLPAPEWLAQAKPFAVPFATN